MPKSKRMPTKPADARYLIHNWNPNDDLLKALGWLTARYSFLQLVADHCLYWMGPVVPTRAAILFPGLTLGGLLDRLIQLSDETYPPEEAKKFKALFSKASALNKRRNKVVHALWYMLHDAPAFALERHSRAPVKFTADQILDLSKDLYSVGRDILVCLGENRLKVKRPQSRPPGSET